MKGSNRVKIRKTEVLSDDWYTLKKTTFDYLRRDGTWQTQSRETYDRGNGATILLYNLQMQSVILIKQFRYPSYVNGNCDGLLIEAPAGLLEADSPEQSIRKEVAEETGFHIEPPQKVLEAYMSPGSVTEKLYFFIAPYTHHQRKNEGGGQKEEGEDIEVLELSFSQAMQLIQDGSIKDGKTIMLLQYAALYIFSEK
ncbi:NUDIX domain-containing protein [Agarilytica rhodophyticola]|uniref:NUDIX domain-containing protein n=1 Tax=Agarilytica rhodophyticola TaxID=1737490 RepID=UPI000B3471E9|nr:NUDIX domain-containing protein [Agarilytica rhodophyticola]